MRRTRYATVLLLIFLTATAATAQGLGDLQLPARPQASPVLGLIPQDATAYVIVNDLKSLSDSVDAMAKKIGVAELMPGSLLPLVQGAAGLGNEFEPERGIALVVPNLDRHGIDVGKMIRGEQQMQGPPPFVVYLPGKTVEGLFPNAQVSAQGGLRQVRIQGGMPPMLAKTVAGYVALGLSPKAVEEAGPALKSVATDLSKMQAKALGQSHVYLGMNMKVLGPIYLELMDVTAERMDQQIRMFRQRGWGVPPSMQMGLTIIKGYKAMVSPLMEELEQVGIAARIAEDAFVLDEVVSFAAGGKLAAMLTSDTVAPGKLLGRLWGTDYVLAAGSLPGPAAATEQMNKLIDQIFDALQEADLPVQLPSDTAKRIKDMAAAYQKQAQGSQFVAGGAPGGNGMFAVSMVTQCKDPNAVKGILRDEAQLLNDVVQETLAGLDDDFAGMEISYVPGVESVGGTTVDAMTLTHPELAEMRPQERDTMRVILGEDKIRLLVGQAGDDAVVVNFGGGTAGMRRALSAAGGAGDLPQDEGVRKALKELPSELSGVLLFSPGNLLTVVNDGAVKMGQQAAPFDFTVKTPIAMGVLGAETDAQVTLAVPADIIAEGVRLWKSMQARMGGPPPSRGGAGEEDF